MVSRQGKRTGLNSGNHKALPATDSKQVRVFHMDVDPSNNNPFTSMMSGREKETV